MNKFSKTEPFFPWLFYAGLFLMLLGTQPLSPTAATQDAILRISGMIGRVGAGLLVLRILTFFPRHPRYVLSCLCMLVIFRFAYILGGTRNLFYLTLAVAASRDADLKISLRIYLVYLAFFFIAGPASWVLGWTDNVATHMGQLRGGSFGFYNPNTLAAMIAMAAFLGILSARQRRTALICIVCWSAAALTFFLTLCLTQTLVLLAVPAIYLLFRRVGLKPCLLAALPLICLALSVILASCFGPGYGSDTFVSRFSIPALVYDQYGLSLFGQDCGLDDWFKGEFPYILTIDNAYLNTFLCEGLVAGLAGMAFFIHLLFLIGKKGDRLLAAVACCIMVTGMMENTPFNIRYSFLPLFYLPLVEGFASSRKKAALNIPFALVLALAVYVFLPWHPHRDSPRPYGTLGEIPCPAGFTRVEYDPDSFSAYVESLPLARPDSVPAGYDGTRRDTLARLCWRVVDFPLINEDEQCADVCMRLRAEYLYRDNRFRRIRFADTRGKNLRYRFGACRPLFVKYLDEVFKWSNTESMRRSLALQPLEGLVPGDVFVYDKDSRPGEKYGHAVMVAAVAIDTASSRKAVLLIQGSTPACDIHVVANPDAPELSPWYVLDESGDPTPALTAGRAVFYAEDLRHF